MSNCSCTSCGGSPCSTPSSCPTLSCKILSIDGRDDTCSEIGLQARPSSLVASEIDGFKASNGSEEDKINLKLMRTILSSKSVIGLDSAGNMGQVVADESLEGQFLGVLNGKFQLLRLSESLLSYDSSSVSSSRDGTLAMWACGPNGTLILKQLDLTDCNVGVDSEGKVVCRDSKVCLKSSTDDIVETGYLVVLNANGCLARIPIPSTANMCYDLAIEAGKLKVVEKRDTKYFVPSGGVEVVNASPLITTSGTVNVSAHIPAGKCFSSVQVIVKATIVAASRANAGANVKVGGYTVGTLACYWYQASSCNVVIDVPLGNDGTFSWEIILSGSLNAAASVKIHLVSFS